jgi:ABC-type multidrug transport system ATPase subunit
VVVSHLRASYDHRVLTDVSFTAAPGATTVVAGSPGSGKTTLVRILLGRMTPDGGEVTIGGRSPVDASPAELAALHGRTRSLFSGIDAGSVGRRSSARIDDPDDGVDPKADVGGNIRRALVDTAGPGAVDDRVRRCLATFDLTDDEHRRARDLDPGTRRRLALARVFVTDPTLVLLDDPVGALEPADRDAVVAALRRARTASAATIILTCYDVATTKAVGDHLVALVGGRVRTEGPVDRLLHLIRSDDDYATQFGVGGKAFAGDSTASLAEHKKLLGLRGYDQRLLVGCIAVIGLLCLLAILAFMALQVVY